VVFEFDESGFSCSNAEASKCQEEKTITTEGDDGVGFVEKSTSARISGCGGMTVSGEPLRPCFIFNSGESLDPSWLTDANGATITTDGVDANGATIEATFSCNQKGSFKSVNVTQFLMSQIGVLPKATAEKPWIAFIDGVYTHIQADFIRFCRANHIVVLLKTPYLSFALQGADLVCGQFRGIKSAYRKNLSRTLDIKVIPHMRPKAGGATVEAQHLGHADFVDAVREPWRAAFNDRAKNINIWGHMGIYPFTKEPLFLKMDAEAAASAKTKKLSRKGTKEAASAALTTAVTGMFGRSTSAEKKKSTRINAGGVWKKHNGVATCASYMAELEEVDGKKAAAEAEGEKLRLEKEEKRAEATEARKKLCDEQWARMAEADYDHMAFPGARPKLLGLDSMRAILEHKYSGNYGALKKLSADDLKNKLLPHLAMLHTATASANK
jgi:hypothetical protein